MRVLAAQLTAASPRGVKPLTVKWCGPSTSIAADRAPPGPSWTPMSTENRLSAVSASSVCLTPIDVSAAATCSKGSSQVLLAGHHAAACEPLLRPAYSKSSSPCCMLLSVLARLQSHGRRDARRPQQVSHAIPQPCAKTSRRAGLRRAMREVLAQTEGHG